MPKTQKKALTVDSITHPKSRKAIKLFKNHKKKESRQKTKMVTHVKNNLIGEKLLWFQERIPDDMTICSKAFVDELIQTYLARFDDELEQIRLKHSIGQRNKRQHASREDMIRHTQETERLEYNTCGLELPNLLDEAQLKVLKEWNGELRFLQNFKLVRLGKKQLQSESSDISMDYSTKIAEKSKETITESNQNSPVPSESSDDESMME